MPPKELEFAGVYFPPLLVAAVMALVATWVTAKVCDRWRLTRYVAYPQLVLLSVFLLYTVLLGTFVIRA